MILNAKKECMILDSEKDFIKFYHANPPDVLEEQKTDFEMDKDILELFVTT